MNQVNNLDAWRALVAVAEEGSITKAAKSLGLEPSSVSRMVTALEKAFCRDLLIRTPSESRLTEDGNRFVRGIKPVIKAHSALVQRFLNEASEMQGLIRVAMAGGLLQNSLSPMLHEFQALYPNVNFLVTSGRLVEECIRGEIDVASVTNEVTNPAIVSLPRGRSVFLPVASPEYLRKNGVPICPEDLRNHSGFVYTGPVRTCTTELERDGQKRQIQWGHATYSTDIMLIKDAVLNGHGCAVDLPLLHCHKELEEGRLVVILDGWHRPPAPAYCICSTSAWRIRRIRFFMQWWCDKFMAKFGATEKILRKVLGDKADIYLS